MAQRIVSFPPVWREDAKVLILGSMPSVESLRQGFYYAHPRNAFWPVISEILGEKMPESVEGKKDMLIRHRIALWDSARSCEREGSLDSAIREARPNDFESLYRDCPGIRHVLFNGAAAFELYKKLVAREDALRSFHRMPSTSPAYTLKYESKKAAWEEILLACLKEDEDESC